MDEEQTAPKVTGAPDAIWLVYGELDADATHAECYASGEVTWSRDAQYPADIRYTRTDLVAQRVREALDAREFIHAESSRIYARLAGAVRAGADDAALAKLVRDAVEDRASNGETVDTETSVAAKLRGEIAMLRATMESAAYQLTKARIWNGMGWHYNVLHPLHYKPALDRLREVLDSSV